MVTELYETYVAVQGKYGCVQIIQYEIEKVTSSRKKTASQKNQRLYTVWFPERTTSDFNEKQPKHSNNKLPISLCHHLW